MGQASLPAEGSWTGQAAFLIGGGPSLKAFNWDLLKGRRCIAVNMAFLNVPHADFFFTEDDRVISELIPAKEELKKAWAEFEGIKLWHCLDESFKEKVLRASPDVHVIQRLRRDKFWSKTWAEGLSYSSNSMIGAINIATILNADPIYLLGVDCRRTKEDANFHSLYPWDWRMPEGQDKNYASDFTHWAALHTKGRRVINLINPEFESALTCWPRIPWVRALPKCICCGFWQCECKIECFPNPGVSWSGK